MRAAATSALCVNSASYVQRRHFSGIIDCIFGILVVALYFL